MWRPCASSLSPVTSHHHPPHPPPRPRPRPHRPNPQPHPDPHHHHHPHNHHRRHFTTIVRSPSGSWSSWTSYDMITVMVMVLALLIPKAFRCRPEDCRFTCCISHYIVISDCQDFAAARPCNDILSIQGLFQMHSVCTQKLPKPPKRNRPTALPRTLGTFKPPHA